MDQGAEEVTMNQKEINRFQLKVGDVRETKDAGQQLALSNRLQEDKVDLALVDTKKLLGAYSTVEPGDLSIQITEGKIGEGTIKGTIIQIQLPRREQVAKEMKTMLGPIMANIQKSEGDVKCEEIAIAVSASTVLHEGVHGLIESKPGSMLAQDFERVSGIVNKNGEASTLLDEGIAYAIQRIYAPEVEPVGSLAPIARETDNGEVRLRKGLGEKLEPKVKEYLDQERAVDDSFLSFAADSFRDLGASGIS